MQLEREKKRYKIIRKEKEAKEYIALTGKMLKSYKILVKAGMDNTKSNLQLKKVVNSIEKCEDYSHLTLKGKVLRECVLGEKSLTYLAEEENYSVSHVYSVKQKILKEFAALLFEVIII